MREIVAKGRAFGLRRDIDGPKGLPDADQEMEDVPPERAAPLGELQVHHVDALRGLVETEVPGKKVAEPECPGQRRVAEPRAKPSQRRLQYLCLSPRQLCAQLAQALVRPRPEGALRKRREGERARTDLAEESDVKRRERELGGGVHMMQRRRDQDPAVAKIEVAEDRRDAPVLQRLPAEKDQGLVLLLDQMSRSFVPANFCIGYRTAVRFHREQGRLSHDRFLALIDRELRIRPLQRRPHRLDQPMMMQVRQAALVGKRPTAEKEGREAAADGTDHQAPIGTRRRMHRRIEGEAARRSRWRPERQEQLPPLRERHEPELRSSRHDQAGPCNSPPQIPREEGGKRLVGIGLASG